MVTKDEAERRVARGAAHLDQMRPGWFNAVDTDRLRLSSCGDCVIAQLATVDPYAMPFTAGLRQFGLDGNPSVSPYRAAQYGVALQIGDRSQARGKKGYEEDDLSFAHLQDAWIAAIAARKFPARDVEPALAHDAVATPDDQQQAVHSR